jgi:phosphatidylserine decarboxylase precursor
MAQDHEVVQQLREMLRNNGWMRPQLQKSIEQAKRPTVQTLDDYFAYLNNLVEWIPKDQKLYDNIVEFYWFLDQDAGRELQEQSPMFRRWIVNFANAWGEFLNSTESAKHIESFLDDPRFHIDDYDSGPSGWRTFNEFFARAVRPGKRPVVGEFDDSVIVSPADSVFKAQYPIDDDAEITAKGCTYKIATLLQDTQYARHFEGGTFMHAFLNVNDYHRYHVPVRGEVKDVQHIRGDVYLDVYQDDTGELHARDGTGYQFQQARGLIVQDSPVGLVATLPIGMAQVSSVNITPRVGSYLQKGQEFGYFLFGGSDIIVLFQRDADVRFTIETGNHHKVGEQIAKASTG